MPPAQKVDAAQICATIDANVAKFSARGDSRKATWARKIYRVDDVKAIAEILAAGQLLSRARWLASGPTHADTGNREIVADSVHAHRFARLYFRPATPMQFANEGIRRAADILSGGAHVPVPVFLVFDAKAMLSRQAARFTAGNLAAGPPPPVICSTALEFARLPFDEIYHDESTTPLNRGVIRFHRHAEILYEEQVDLADLAEVVCRTEPERKTLLTFLSGRERELRDLIRVERPGELMFYRRDRTYVEEVSLAPAKLLMSFAPNNGPYRLRVQVWDFSTKENLITVTFDRPALGPDETLQLPAFTRDVFVQIEINECLAYRGRVSRQALVTPPRRPRR